MDVHAFWASVGTITLALGLVDVFLTALNYDEAGFIATPLCALQWRCVRTVTRRLSRRWRRVALRQVTGLQIILALVTWLGCVIAGFGFIYYGLMDRGQFQYDGRGLGPGVFSAMYLSAAQLATVGTSQVSPQTDMLRALTIAETLSGVVLVTLMITFLLGVYQVIRDLRTLSSNFFTADAVAGDPVASLGRYFPNGQPAGIDAYLQAISASFWSYTDGVHLHHLAYYFQSGRDQFSLPYVMHMLGGSIGALRWGLPSGHPATLEPLLTRLTDEFEHFREYLHNRLRWKSAHVPALASFEDFSAMYRGSRAAPDLWVHRFLDLNRNMAQLARLNPTGDPREAYERYRQWLPFAYGAGQATAAVSRDLDYQPMFRGADQIRPSLVLVGEPPAAGSRPVRSWRGILTRLATVPDPGLTRLRTAISATSAAGAAVVTVYTLYASVGIQAFPQAMFGGMVGMWAATMPRDTAAPGRKFTTLLTALPAVGAAALGAALAPSFVLSTAGLGIVVLLEVWIGGLGPRFAALGLVAFMSYYFGLVLHFRLALFPSLAVAVAVGVVWAYLLRFVLIVERPDRVLKRALAAFQSGLILLLDPLIDAVSAARWDPDIRKRVRTNMRQLRRCGAFLQGQFRSIEPASTHTRQLRLLLFDTELAANNLTASVRHVCRAGTVVPLVLRGQLAGMLDRAQDQLDHTRPESDGLGPLAPIAPDGRAEYDSEDWPVDARRLRDAIDELVHAATAVHEIPTARLIESQPGAASAGPRSHPDVHTAFRAGERKRLISGLVRLPSGRLAVQAAIATGLALIAGGAVSSGNQYWAALAAFLVSGGTETVEETFVKGFQRIAGTIAGAIAGFWVTTLTGANPFVVLPLLAVSVFAAMYMQPVSYSVMVFWMTMMLSLLYDFLGTLQAETLDVRVVETVIGAAIALAASAFVFPTRTREKVNAEATAFLHTLGAAIQASLERVAGNPVTASSTALALTLDQQLRRLDASAAPLRRAPGSLSRDGIERRLTAAAALTYYARHLIKTSETFTGGASAAAASEWSKLATLTQDNIFALIQVLAGELPGPIHGSEEFPVQPDTPQEGAEPDAVLHNVVRINETVRTLIEDLTQDTAERTRGAAPRADAR